MAFTELTTGHIDESNLYTVIEELKTAVLERHAFLSNTGAPAFTTDMHRGERGGDAIYRIRNWISWAVGGFEKADFKVYGDAYPPAVSGSLDDLLDAAGYPDGWIENDTLRPGYQWHVSDARVWKQLQDVLALMTRVVSRVVDSATGTRIGRYDTGANRQAAWTAMLAKSPTTASGSGLWFDSGSTDATSYLHYLTPLGWYGLVSGDADYTDAIKAMSIDKMRYWIKLTLTGTRNVQIDLTDNLGKTIEITSGATTENRQIDNATPGVTVQQLIDNKYLLDTTLPALVPFDSNGYVSATLSNHIDSAPSGFIAYAVVDISSELTYG